MGCDAHEITMTFLEFLLTKYLGKANGTGESNGVSYWDCPVCEHDTFHTLPDKPPMKHRARCHNSECRFGGDAADMLKQFHQREPWGDRRERLASIELEFEQLKQDALVGGRGV
jgi:hypothetical protein